MTPVIREIPIHLNPLRRRYQTGSSLRPLNTRPRSGSALDAPGFATAPADEQFFLDRKIEGQVFRTPACKSPRQLQGCHTGYRARTEGQDRLLRPGFSKWDALKPRHNVVLTGLNFYGLSEALPIRFLSAISVPIQGERQKAALSDQHRTRTVNVRFRTDREVIYFTQHIRTMCNACETIIF